MFGQCVPTSPPSYQKYFENCGDLADNARLDDLYAPIRVFYQNLKKGFCVDVNNAGDVLSLNNNFDVQNLREFKLEMQNFYNDTHPLDKSLLYQSSSWNITVPQLYMSNFNFGNFTGYLPMAPLMSGSMGNLTIFKIPLVSPYGQCKNGKDLVKFLQNKNFICANKLEYTESSCRNFNYKHFDINKSVLAYNTTTNLTTTINPKVIIRKVYTKLYYTETEHSSFDMESSLSNPGNTRCTCTNIITKVEYNFLTKNETITGMVVTYYVEDFSNTCDTKDFVPVNYIVSYKSEEVKIV